MLTAGIIIIIIIIIITVSHKSAYQRANLVAVRFSDQASSVGLVAYHPSGALNSEVIPPPPFFSVETL